MLRPSLLAGFAALSVLWTGCADPLYEPTPTPTPRAAAQTQAGTGTAAVAESPEETIPDSEGPSGETLPSAESEEALPPADSTPQVAESVQTETPGIAPEDLPPLLTTAPGDTAWQDLPVIPPISARVLEIYAYGQTLGRDPYSFSVIGDCQSVESYFLASFDTPGEYSLGEEYAYLQETIDRFSVSFGRERITAQDGFNGASVFSAFWADPTLCEPGETPIQCEFRVHNPSIVLISLGTNSSELPVEDHEQFFRDIIEYAVARGIVPVLSTKADNLEGDHSINATIAALAQEYDIPLWNFWRAAQALPHRGLEDEYHLSYARDYFDDPERMRFGWPVRNLTALQVLDAVWRAVEP